MRFKSLRLHGYKSFADAVHIPFSDDITAIIGPNGCGKSNIVEALRWVMGESSPKKMRGEEMDDMIFNGTQSRPARNIAEVILTLECDKPINNIHQKDDAHDGTYPIVISRRIQRGHGSQYRINDHETRARDIQLLLADFATGANASAIVGQNAISELITARPSERRYLIEEAANIRGLQTRRHDAQLRHEKTLQNVQSLYDKKNQLHEQRKMLEKQVKQAKQYRHLSQLTKISEACALYCQWQHATQQLKDITEQYNTRHKIWEDHQKIYALERADYQDISGKISVLRDDVEQANHQLQEKQLQYRDIAHNAERLRDKIEYTTKSLQQFHDKMNQTNSDITILQQQKQEKEKVQQNITQQISDNNHHYDNLTKEKTNIFNIAEKYRLEYEALNNDLTTRESTQNFYNQQQQNLLAQKDDIEKKITAYNNILHHKDSNMDNSNYADNIKQQQDILNTIITTQQQHQHNEENLNQQWDILNEQERQNLIDTQQKKQDLDQEYQEAYQRLESTKAKITALQQIIEQQQQNRQDIQAVIDQCHVSSTYESAVSTALGEILLASLINELNFDDTQHLTFCRMPLPHHIPPLPDNALPISAYINDQGILTHLLPFIGVVDNKDEFAVLQLSLYPGQMIVSKDGWGLRWDGLIISPYAQKNTSLELQYRQEYDDYLNILPTLQQNFDHMSKMVNDFDHTQNYLRKQWQNQRQALENDIKQQRHHIQQQQQKRDITTKKINQLREEQLQQQAKRQKQEKELTEYQYQHQQIVKQIQHYHEKYESLNNNHITPEDINKAKALWQHANDDYQNILQKISAIHETQNHLQWQIQQINHDIKDISEKIIMNQENQKDSEILQAQVVEQYQLLRDQPENLKQEQQSLSKIIANAENDIKKAKDNLHNMNKEYQKKRDNLIKFETQERQLYDDYQQQKSLLERQQDHLAFINQQISERCQTNARNIITQYDLQDHLEKNDDMVYWQEQLEKNKNMRLALGAVNLQSEEQAETLDHDIDILQDNINELEHAVKTLQQAINALNSEGKKRLLKALDDVNHHFSTLYQKIFQGGDARLSLSQYDDDPLNAGIEIEAQPPGKKMQHLNLMSGGEKALAGIALLFAIFLTNPAPICILDEVDAPLDDYNVDRFCALIQEMATQCPTKFIIVTHNRITMTHAKHLYGITMTEKGVSSLVRVNIEKALELIDDV